MKFRNPAWKHHHLASLGLVGAALILGGCGGDNSSHGGQGDDGTPPATSTLSGTAAVGAAITGATLTAKCADGSGFTGTVTTDLQGAWSGTVDSDALPCALRVSGGAPPVVLHSYATSAGTVNLTPLTDLTLAIATASDPADWFSTPSPTLVAGALENATVTLGDALDSAGFSLPPGAFTPFSTGFVIGDIWDQLLDALQAAIDADSTLADYQALIDLVKDGNLGNFPAPAEEPEGPDGDGAALGDANGATGTFNGSTHTFLANEASSIPNVGWSGLGISGTYHFEAYKPQGDSFDSLTSWRIVGVPGEPGTYACRTDEEQALPLVRFAQNGAPVDASRCTIEILSATPTAVTGRFSGVFDGHTLTDGYFRVSPSTGGGGSLPPGESGASFTVDGTEYFYPTATDGSYYDDYRDYTYSGFTGTPGDSNSPGYPLGFQLHTLPDAPGTYACDQEASPGVPNADYRKVNVWFYWNGLWYYGGNRANPAPAPAGSSCTITLTSAGSTIEGSFNGTFVTADGTASLTVTDGLFRYIAP